MLHLLPQRQEIAQGHLHEHHRLPAPHVRLLPHALKGLLQHVQGDAGDRAEASALDQDRRVVEELRGLHYFAVRCEEGRVRQALLDKLKAHEPVVHSVESRAGEPDHVHFHPVPGQGVHEGCDKELGPLAFVERPVDQVDAQHAQRLLLARILLVPHAGVDDDFRRPRPRLCLEPDAQPALPLLLAGEAPGGHRISEHEELRRGAACSFQPLKQQAPFVIQHGLQALPADVAPGRAIDGVGYCHIVCGNRLGDGGGRAPDMKEPAGNLLTRADLGNRSVPGRIDVDAERLVMSAQRVHPHDKSMHQPHRNGQRGADSSPLQPVSGLQNEA